MSIKRQIIFLTAATLAFCAVALGPARAQGRTVTDFTLPDAAKTNVSLSSYASSKAVVVVFINQNCAFSKLYQGRLSSLASSYGGRGVQFLFVDTPINIDAANAGNPQKLTLQSSSGGITYLTDDDAKVSTLLGATKTPEVVVLQPAGNGFAVRYKGSIDDNPQMANDVRQPYLAQALDHLLAGQPVGVADNRPNGCLIKKF